jgi:hypothetical protein
MHSLRTTRKDYDMPADRDISPEDREYAAQLLEIAQQELDELDTDNPTLVAAVVLHALIEMFEDAAHGYVTLAGLPVVIRQGLEDERLITPPQKYLVGLDDEKEQQRQVLYRHYLHLIEQRGLSEVDGFDSHRTH